MLTKDSEWEMSMRCELLRLMWYGLPCGLGYASTSRKIRGMRSRRMGEKPGTAGLVSSSNVSDEFSSLSSVLASYCIQFSECALE